MDDAPPLPNQSSSFQKKTNMRNLYALLWAALAALPAAAQSPYFPPTTGNTWEALSPASLSWCPAQIDSLYAYLDANDTKAFILLKDGKIVLEKYFGTHSQTTPWMWASAGKTITAFMVGIAQQEGRLSINDPTSDYLGRGWTACTPAQEANITIRHQLTMTSGLDDQVADPYCTLDSCLRYKAPVGTRWAYHNGPYTLLDSVLERATGMSLNTYTTQKLKAPTGMTGSFFAVGYNNVYFSTARSMARFGLLMLNKGNWNGTQILRDTAYFNAMVRPSQSINRAYGYLWWLNGYSPYMLPSTQLVFNGFLNPNAPADLFVAMGRDGQFLNIVPSQNLVWLRMGNAPDGLPVPFLLNDKIWQYVRNLECKPTSLREPDPDPTLVQLSPNPAAELLHIRSERPISNLRFFNAQGQLLKSEQAQGRAFSISLRSLPKGLVILRAEFDDGRTWTGKVLVE
ncbi:MAG: hypothetical protein RL181_218 [Bacteroidota bacterium]